jgi:predicted RNase H-like HicB family nuclease
MNRTLDEYMRLPYETRVFQDEADGNVCYVAEHAELPGCIAQGATTLEAVRNLGSARRDYIATMIEDGVDVPLPTLYNAFPARVAVMAPEIAAATPRLGDTLVYGRSECVAT